MQAKSDNTAVFEALRGTGPFKLAVTDQFPMAIGRIAPAISRVGSVERVAAHGELAGALGAKQPFVAGGGLGMAAAIAHIHRQHARRLRAVDKIPDAVRGGQFADGFDGQDLAGGAGDMRYAQRADTFDIFLRRTSKGVKVLTTLPLRLCRASQETILPTCSCVLGDDLVAALQP